MHRGRFALAVAASIALILAAPFIGRIRNVIRDVSGGHFALVLGVVVAACAAAAVVVAVVTIRHRRLLRFGVIGGALTLAVASAILTSSPDPQVAAVERFHFVQYGLITFLFYRAWRPLGDAGTIVLPVLAALTTATVEEWFQWFIPGRVGVVEDVFLNWTAIVCGLLFSAGIDPPSGGLGAFGARARRQAGLAGALLVVVFGLFFDSVHLGHRIEDPAIGSFVSIHTADGLRAHARDRAARWPTAPPVDRTRLAREDQYRTEGLQHVQARNEAWERGDIDAAWRENLILEAYYEPVLRQGHEWPAAQHRDASQRAAMSRRTTPFESAASPYAIHTWPRAAFWLPVLALAAGLLAIARRAWFEARTSYAVKSP
jgi:hypothetical protein